MRSNKDELENERVLSAQAVYDSVASSLMHSNKTGG
jgi:hypothetical protein